MALFIERESISGLRDTFIKNTKNLVFRRVNRVVSKPDDLVGQSVKKVLNGVVEETFFKPGEEREPFTAEEWLQNVEELYTKFHFFTSPHHLRENDKINISIYGASNRLADMDLFDVCDFRLKLQPKKEGSAPPRIGDLVCGLVNQPRNRRNPEYKFWFVCSEQFFRAWTAIHYEEHESLSKKCGNDEDQIKRHLMSGNRLCTNGALKLILGANDNNIEIPSDELAKKFYRVRTENASRYWVHIYTFLVMAIRYLEYPTGANVPNNLDDTPKMKKWNLPDDWVTKIFSKYGVCEAEEGQVSEFVEQPRDSKMNMVVEKEGSLVNVRLLKSLTTDGEIFTRDLKETKDNKDREIKKILSAETDFPRLPEILRKPKMIPENESTGNNAQ